MAESVIFILIVGIGLVVLLWSLGITWIDPRIIIGFLFMLILPGIYAAFTSGPFVPSARKRHKTMIKLAKLKKTDTIYDLGCGDGRLVFESAKIVKKAIGYELSIPLVLFGNIRKLLTLSKAHIRFGNIWTQDYSKADVIFCYLLPNAMKTFYKEVWPKLKPGTRVISNAFQIHDIKPSKIEEKVYLYIKK